MLSRAAKMNAMQKYRSNHVRNIGEIHAEELDRLCDVFKSCHVLLAIDELDELRSALQKLSRKFANPPHGPQSPRELAFLQIINALLYRVTFPSVETLESVATTLRNLVDFTAQAADVLRESLQAELN